MKSLDLSTSDVYWKNITCPHLQSLILTECTIQLNAEMHLPVLHHLYLDSLDSTSFHFQDIAMIIQFFKSPQLQYLDLSNNEISEMGNNLAQFFSNLTYLDLSHNKLTSISNLKHLVNIRTLILHGNAITIVSNAILSSLSRHPYKTILDLRNNQLVCDCSVEAFRTWVLTDNMVLLQHGDYQCYLQGSKQNISITEVNLDDCKSYLIQHISIGITFTIAALVVVVVVAVRYRWHIKYRFFLLVNRRNQQHFLVNDDDRIDDDEDGIPRYDAYVPYHIEDEDWVDEELLANIEKGEERFRLCLKTRDIRAGRPIFGELSLHIMLEAIKFLLYSTCRFVEDNWCYFELNMAHHRVMEEGRNVMILILLEEIPDNKMTLLLRQLFCRVQLLKWPDDEHGQYIFWRRLREELKRPVPLDRRFDI
ncbi:toll-like receptor 4 [Amphiura filiformis]|uniref:toll-like receptor 4 n=1 Tax=Amphiura filiformis TaxID=82378 RepID=UPI003B21EF21